MAVEVRHLRTPDGAALFDAALDAHAPDARWFDVAFWRARGEVRAPGGGRGSAWHVTTPVGAAVLRHYRRGGLIAAVMGDRYWYLGAERTRAFAEFRLLLALRERDLPVPRPLAARYARGGVFYRADLLVETLTHARTLAEVLAAAPETIDWPAIGRCIARFHRAGAFHADLNAHNVLLRAREIWLIDFDRGALREPHSTWQMANLLRLRRSLLKLGAVDAVEDFDGTAWPSLLDAHAEALLAEGDDA
jgi:3-deoxy-D-manno-octulosonic acid kinase